MKRKQVIGVAAFVIVGAVVLIWGLIRVGVIGGMKPPAWVGGQPIELIDVTTGELVTKSYEDWEELGRKGDRWKNPETGEYTMTKPITCGSCGAKIPPPSSGPDPEGTGLGLIRAIARANCPKCGKPVVPSAR